jgi:hypothetical protein|tara:strand:- start:159 stop:461 length:303 start_codon:yes stop_codon:yes gene_type:complete
MKYASGKYARAICDRCGFEYPYTSLQKEWNGLKVCTDCFEPKHPQLEPPPPPFEPEALYDPRPDRAEGLDIFVGQKTFPVLSNASTHAITSVGKVEVVVS